jgi:hypothetical protein
MEKRVPICKMEASVAMNHEPAEEFMTGVSRKEQKKLYRMTKDSSENMLVRGCGRAVCCFDLKISAVLF